ncbi:DNA polymerase [Vibrio phage D148]
MAAFKPAKATLEECYEQIRTLGKATPSIIKRIEALEDFSEYDDDYVKLVCRTPGLMYPLQPMLTETDECEVLVIQNHIPFPEKWKRGVELNYMHQNQLRSMMPSDITFEVTSLVKFSPQLFNHAKNGKVQNKFTATQMKGWLPYLLEEINRVKPKVIVAMSSEVVKLLGLKMSNTNNRGEVHISPVCGLPVVITLHPKVLNMIRQNASGGMWGDDYYSVIQRDLWKASDLVNERLSLIDINDAIRNAQETQITVCQSIEEVREWSELLMSLPPKQFTSWDLETNNLDPWWRGTNRLGQEDHARILTSQVGYRREDGSVHAIVFPLWHRDNVYYDPDEAFEIHKTYLLRDSGKVGHNITFDICFLAATTGVRLQGTILDTLLALHSLDSGIKGCYGLKAAVWDYLLPSGFGGYEGLLEVEEDDGENDDISR